MYCNRFTPRELEAAYGDYISLETLDQDSEDEGTSVLPVADHPIHRVLTELLIEDTVWSTAALFCPPRNDNTGIARVDVASTHVHVPSRNKTRTLFTTTPDRTWLSFGVYDEQGSHTVIDHLADYLLNSIITRVTDIVSRHTVQSDTGANPSSETTGGHDSSRNTGSERIVSIRENISHSLHLDDEVIAAIRSTFCDIDNIAVWIPLAAACSALAEHRSQYVESQSSPLDRLNLHNLRDIQSSCCSAIVGVYDSGTRVCRIALAGDSRAVLSRPFVNPSFDQDSAGHLSRTTPPPPLQSDVKDLPVPESFAHHLEGEPLLDPLLRSSYPILYEARQLSSDHVPSSPTERIRIHSLHQAHYQRLFTNDEPSDSSTPHSTSTYLGKKMTRGFGYRALKWSLEIQELMHRKLVGELTLPKLSTDKTLQSLPSPPSFDADSIFDISDSTVSWAISILEETIDSHSYTSNGRKIAQNPYLSSEPEITTLQVQPGDFIVVGSRGLFECLSSEEVLGLVGAWLEERRRKAGGGVWDLNTYEAQHPSAFAEVAPSSSLKDEDFVLQSLNYHRDRSRPEYVKRLEAMEDNLNGLNQDASDRKEMNPGNSESPQPSAQLYSLNPDATSRLILPSELPVVSGSTVSSASDLQSSPSSKDRASQNDGWRWEQSWGIPKSEIRYAVYEQDLDSVSVHIARNALGGANDNLRRVLLGLSPTDVVNFRDNVSVQVIFFE